VATRLRDARRRAMEELRYEPTKKRVRAFLGNHTVADSTRAVLVWEPRRVLPSYAVLAEDLRAELLPSSATPSEDGDARDAPILHGGFPFSVHSTAGEALDLRAGGETREGAAFRAADPDLSDYAVLDFHAFDWYEEDEPISAHPRDPYHRVDIRRGSRHIRVELDGELIAESSRPQVVFETSLPVRFYLPREDVRVPMRPTEKRTRCAYKGEAMFLALEVSGGPREDLAWSYVNPLREARELEGLVAFFNEKTELFVDGERQEPPRTGVAATIVEESGV
jgi:uncharacterized protein (DUF427 family)